MNDIIIYETQFYATYVLHKMSFRKNKIKSDYQKLSCLVNYVVLKQDFT